MKIFRWFNYGKKGSHWDFRNLQSISKCIYKLLLAKIPRGAHILEAGSSTGHISFQLAYKGYKVSLLEIRSKVLEEARSRFKILKNYVELEFHHGDIMNHKRRYDFIWNTGLLNSYPDSMQERMIQHLASCNLCPRGKLLMIYPDTDGGEKKLGIRTDLPPGVQDAMEYSVKNVPLYFYKYFSNVEQGKISKQECGMEFDWIWCCAENRKS